MKDLIVQIVERLRAKGTDHVKIMWTDAEGFVDAELLLDKDALLIDIIVKLEGNAHLAPHIFSYN